MSLRSFCVLGVFLLILSVVMSSVSADWYDSGSWEYRKRITIDSDQVSSNLSNFPILINITDSDLASDAQSDGDDILFTNETGTKLNHEIEYWNDSTGELIAWVNVTSLCSSSDTIIYMYYGNDTCANQESVADVWDGHYIGVWHLSETTGDALDSTNNDNDGTVVSATQGVTGKIGNAYEFDGINDKITTIDTHTLSEVTIEALFNYDTVEDGTAEMVSNYEANSGEHVGLRIRDTDHVLFFVDDNIDAYWNLNNTNTLINDTWYYGAGTFSDDDDEIKIFVNNTVTTYDSINTGEMECGEPFVFGAQYHWSEGWNKWYDGTLDEVRISDIERTEDWINTSYLSIMNATDGNFFTIGIEETSDLPEIEVWTPPDGATNVPVNNCLIKVNITHPTGAQFNYSWACSDGSYNMATGNTNGTKYLMLCMNGLLDCGTTYTWWVNASVRNDPANYTNESYSFTTVDCEGSYSDVHPANASNNICPCADCNDFTCVCIDASHKSGNNVNISFYSNYSGVWVVIQNYTNVSGRYCAFFQVEYDHQYWWYANITKYNDDSNYNQTEVFTFITGSEDTCASIHGFSSAEFSAFILMDIFILFMFLGYLSKKPSGGAFMLLSGFTLIALSIQIDVLYASALIVPIALFIVVLGIRKWFFPLEHEKRLTEGE